MYASYEKSRLFLLTWMSAWFQKTYGSANIEKKNSLHVHVYRLPNGGIKKRKIQISVIEAKVSPYKMFKMSKFGHKGFHASQLVLCDALDSKLAKDVVKTIILLFLLTPFAELDVYPMSSKTE